MRGASGEHHAQCQAASKIGPPVQLGTQEIRVDKRQKAPDGVDFTAKPAQIQPFAPLQRSLFRILCALERF